MVTMLGLCLYGDCSRLMGAPCCRFANIQDKDAIQEKILEKKKVADTAENVSKTSSCTSWHARMVAVCGHLWQRKAYQ